MKKCEFDNTPDYKGLKDARCYVCSLGILRDLRDDCPYFKLKNECEAKDTRWEELKKRIGIARISERFMMDMRNEGSQVAIDVFNYVMEEIKELEGK